MVSFWVCDNIKMGINVICIAIYMPTAAEAAAAAVSTAIGQLLPLQLLKPLQTIVGIGEIR